MSRKAKSFAVLSALLLATGLTSASCSPSREPVGGVDPARQQDVQDQTHAISVQVDPRIQVQVASEAKAGEAVEVTLTYDESIAVDALLVNGEKAVRKDAHSFYFEMPGEDVTLTVDADIPGAYTLVNLTENEDVELYGFDRFDAGDRVEFKLGFKPGSGYTIADVTVGVLNEEGTQIATPIDYDFTGGVYSFTAPENLTTDIGVKAETEGKLFPINKLSADANISSIQVEDGEGWKDITYTNYAYAGKTIKVVLKDTDAALVKGVKIQETKEELLLAEDAEAKEITFTMPAREVTLESIVEDNLLPVKIVIDGAATTATLYREVAVYDEENQRTTYKLQPIADNRAIPGERVYIKYTYSDDDHKVTAKKGTYTNSYGSTTNISLVHNASYDADYFNMVNANDVTITLTVSEKMHVTLNNQKGLVISLYTEGEGDELVSTDGGFPGDTLYADVNPSITGAPEYSNLYVTYADEDGYFNAKALEKEDSYYADHPGYYSFDIDEGCTGYSLSLSFASQFAGYTFLGDYVSTEVYTNNSDKTLSSNVTVNDTSFVERSSWGSDTVTDILIVNGDKDSTSGTILLGDRTQAAYAPNIIVWGYYGGPLTDDDVYIMVKPVEGKTLHVRNRFLKTPEHSGESWGDNQVGLFEVYYTEETSTEPSGGEEGEAETPTETDVVLYRILLDFEHNVQYLQNVTFDYEGEFLDADKITVKVDDTEVGTYENDVFTWAEPSQD